MVLDLAAWRHLATTPAAGAAELRRRLAALDPAARTAGLAWLADEATWEAVLAARPAAPLGGVPVLVKDLWDIAGVPTRAGSRFLGEFRGPAARDAALVEALRAAGAAVLGKTNTHEFAYGLTGENPHFGDCHVPGHPDRLTGGSSSGSAWAVAANLVPVAFGTDTGGSIRVPSAHCGLWGLRLTPGHWTITDAFPLAPGFDTCGWFAHGPGDLHAVLAALDLAPAAQPGHTPRGVFLGLEDLGGGEPDVVRAVREAASLLAPEADRTTRAALLQAFDGSEGAFSVLQSREAWEVHRRWLDARRADYDPAVWTRIDRGRRWSSDQLAVADRHRISLARTWADFFRDHDFLVMPSAPFRAPTKAQAADPASRSAVLRLTTPASLGGLPAIAQPLRLGDGLDAGLQIILPHLRSPALPALLGA